jgi:hypothetical protein
MSSHDVDESRLRRLLIEAEAATRRAGEALLQGLPEVPVQVRDETRILIDHCQRCPDPFQALDVARVLRALLDDLDSAVYSQGSATEWAYAETRLQAMASRIARLLRDQHQLIAEQAIVNIAVQHLRSLEDHPRYREIIGEMTRITLHFTPDRPVPPADEFLGLARRDFTLPTQPPATGV